MTVAETFNRRSVVNNQPLRDCFTWVTIVTLAIMLCISCIATGDESSPEPVFAVKFIDYQYPRGQKTGPDFTVVARLKNTSQRWVLTSIRLRDVVGANVLAPGNEQLAFLEPGKESSFSWRLRKLSGHEPSWDVSINEIQTPLGAPTEDARIPALTKHAIEATWSGQFSLSNGELYDAELRVHVHEDGIVDGRIHWVQRRPGNGSTRKDTVGKKGVEHVLGAFEPSTGVLRIAGFRLDDPNGVLAMARYRLTLSEDLRTLNGTTWSYERCGKLDLVRDTTQ